MFENKNVLKYQQTCNYVFLWLEKTSFPSNFHAPQQFCLLNLIEFIDESKCFRSSSKGEECGAKRSVFIANFSFHWTTEKQAKSGSTADLLLFFFLLFFATCQLFRSSRNTMLFWYCVLDFKEGVFGAEFAWGKCAEPSCTQIVLFTYTHIFFFLNNIGPRGHSPCKRRLDFKGSIKVQADQVLTLNPPKTKVN